MISTIKMKDAERFRAELGWDSDASLPEGIPTFWTDIGQIIQLNTEADQAYTAKFAYFGRPTALSGDVETNWLTIRYPMLPETCLHHVCR